MATLKGPGSAQYHDGSTLRIAIVHARWNTPIIDALIDGAKRTLLASGVKPENIILQSVPGSYELPYAVSRIYAGSRGSTAPFDAIIAIGVLIKGETMHFEYIADAVSHGLMRVQLDTGVPVIFGLLTVLEERQALARAGMTEDGHCHGEDWGLAAVELGIKRKAWGEGKML